MRGRLKQRLKEISREIEKDRRGVPKKENRRDIELQAQATLAHRMMLVFSQMQRSMTRKLVCPELPAEGRKRRLSRPAVSKRVVVAYKCVLNLPAGRRKRRLSRLPSL